MTIEAQWKEEIAKHVPAAAASSATSATATATASASIASSAAGASDAKSADAALERLMKSLAPREALLAQVCFLYLWLLFDLAADGVAMVCVCVC